MKSLGSIRPSFSPTGPKQGKKGPKKKRGQLTDQAYLLIDTHNFVPLNFSEKHNNLSGCRCSWSWIRYLPAKQVQGFLLYFHFCVSSLPRPCLVLAYPQLVMDATWLRLAFANYWLPFLKSSNLHAFRENFVLMDKGPLLSVLECACVRARISVEALPGDEFIPCMHRNASTHASTSNASGFCVHAPLLNPVSNIVTWFSSCCSSVI